MPSAYENVVPCHPLTSLPAAWSQVARCDYSQDLEDDLQAVGQRTNSLEQKADSDLALLDQSTQDLATDVGSLKGWKLTLCLYETIIIITITGNL